jgi:hypothetical protein
MADAASWLEACRGAGLVDPMPGDLERPKLDDGDKTLLRWAVANSRFGWPTFHPGGLVPPDAWSTALALEALAKLGAGCSKSTLLRLKGKPAPTVGDPAKIANITSSFVPEKAAG